jgi:hypothetical protein
MVTNSFETQFDSLGFVPGVVRGARAFRIGEDGDLTGIFYQQVWSDGVNEAECRRGRQDGLATQYYVIAGHVITTPPEPLGPPEPHGMDTCRHGFYGFYDGSNDYRNYSVSTPGVASGVIEGWGEVMLGTRGFRCTMARLVALTVTEVKLRSRERVERMLVKYASVPFFDTFEQMVEAFPPDKGEA